MTKWQILIIDSSEINVAGLCYFLNKIKTVESIKVATTLKESLMLCDKNHYDLILLNLTIRDYAGFNFLERLLTHNSKLNILTFSACCTFIYALKALKIGAKGYFSTDTAGDVFIKAVERVVTGNKYIDDDLAQKIALHLINDQPHPFFKLTTREFEVFRLLAKGFDSHQIASQLCVSYKTSCNYVSKIKEKLNVQNNVQLLNLANQYGLIPHELLLNMEL
jgi:DNA-binding NarL/FixJ family response regulator